MAKLLLCLEGVVLREFPLDRESFTIGRKAQSDIQIDDITISSKHAVIKVEKNAYMDNIKDVYVEDLGSTNGTLVNGQRIKKHMLRHGDVIMLGRHEFKFLDEDAPDFDKTMMVNPGVEKQLKTRALLPAAIKVLTGPKAGHKLDIVKSYTTLGNAGKTVIISKRTNGYFVAYVHPKGQPADMPPTLNNHPISAQNTPLNDHDLIEIAGMKLEFVLI